MKNRAIIARIDAKKVVSQKQEKVKEKKEPEAKKILMKSLETGEVVKTFDSLEDALNEGYHRPNLVGAINKGSKYKGHLWAEE